MIPPPSSLLLFPCIYLLLSTHRFIPNTFLFFIPSFFGLEYLFLLHGHFFLIIVIVIYPPLHLILASIILLFFTDSFFYCSTFLHRISFLFSADPFFALYAVYISNTTFQSSYHHSHPNCPFIFILSYSSLFYLLRVIPDLYFRNIFWRHSHSTLHFSSIS